MRWRFLLQSLKDLEAQFATYGLRLMCFYGEAHEVIERLVTEWGVNVVSFEKDSEACSQARDNAVKAMCKRRSVQVIECVSHTLYDPDEVYNINSDYPPNTCEEMKRLIKCIGPPDKPAYQPDLEFMTSHLMSVEELYRASEHSVPGIERFASQVKPDCEEQLVCLFEGGETKALQLLERRMVTERETFEIGLISPNLIKPVLFIEEVSLSPYLRFGCLSVRLFYWKLKESFDQVYICFI